MERSETISELVKARIASAADIKNASKNATNPHLKNQYADLESVLEAIAPITKHGLTLFQLAEGTTESVSVTSILAHTSGEWISSTLSIRPDKPTAQGMGSAITYARRYTAAALLGITQADDDGNAASGTTGQQQHRQNQNPAAQKPAASGESIDFLLDKLGKANTDADLEPLLPRLSNAKKEFSKDERWHLVVDAYHEAKARAGAS